MMRHSIAGIAAVAVCVLLAGPSRAALRPVGAALSVHGTVTSGQGQGDTASSLRVGDAVFYGDLVKTGDRSSVMIHFVDGTEIQLGENSEFRIKLKIGAEGKKEQTQIEVVKGKVRVRLGPNPTTFVTTTTGVVVRGQSEGAEFIVQFDPQTNGTQAAMINGSGTVSPSEAGTAVSLAKDHLVGFGVEGLQDGKPQAFTGLPQALQGTDFNKVDLAVVVEALGNVLVLLEDSAPEQFRQLTGVPSKTQLQRRPPTTVTAPPSQAGPPKAGMVDLIDVTVTPDKFGNTQVTVSINNQLRPDDVSGP